ncbi:polysaccharide deacetylase family protein [Actinomadura sp. 7K507]|uniref:polysaccharide deacetylase family protein n=1 Tax=Actinomadura sp. 7K507 TaxID=2530365 RepID=UPI00104D9569|nr:polysaccharide deacetylase family protein [Actinomadura sp. 7K507]TDC82396.1 polysaccharide deacetylase family protein [Actinomadura sp. 7K507]
MDGPNLVRRTAAAVLAAALCGWLSMLAPADERVRLAAARSEAAAPAPKPEPPKPKPKPPPPDCTRAKCLALTFDDGPTESTAGLLDILASRDVKATFFLVGENVAENPGLVRREHQAGHEIADHSYTHADLGRASKKKIVSELTRTQDAIRNASGVTPDLLRPPYGSTSKRLARIAREMGLAQVLWTVDPLDWRHRDTEDIERRVLKDVKPGQIILLHDIHPTTVRAVPKIIDRLSAEGYVFVTVSELFGGKLTPGEEYTELDSGEGQGLP